MLGIIFLAIGLALGIVVFFLGTRANWHWGWALASAAVPVTFVFFLGIIGLLIAGAFVAAIYKFAA
jgi:hypothetical protein